MLATSYALSILGAGGAQLKLAGLRNIFSDVVSPILSVRLVESDASRLAGTTGEAQTSD